MVEVVPTHVQAVAARPAFPEIVGKILDVDAGLGRADRMAPDLPGLLGAAKFREEPCLLLDAQIGLAR
jgi:hypothetical protein